MSDRAEKFPISHWAAIDHPGAEWRPKGDADDLLRPDALCALAAWAAALTREVEALGGNRVAMMLSARSALEALGIDPDHGGAAAVLEKVSGDRRPFRGGQKEI